MHEATIVLGALTIVEEEMKKLGLNTVSRITLCRGELACVEEQTLQGCFEIASQTGFAQGAELAIERIPISFKCTRCDTIETTKILPSSCRHCGSEHLNLATGRELYVKNFEAE
ncbi:hydrogenase maturation nickel metallochaperone HypA/HybF [Pseudodesulfovibrio piezophilus]|uniref:Hydrogenase maturation factor HypA n=1 Tax=Pseudodesulfovibrio piezophilus (strain DSM 21447 / JCM 15486 / C1TLV30) TaxID=1322246 RepID=M1WSL0_PSEP2|nr:hydrogenase maturation nickel metallochaperone HypA [Pseudodesulfovibrio piezophilus]CCH50254.1 putative hydrogenase nickel incorporation protein hypA 1 [Pseudodesulfovibrio piezophilus C1TLV30]